MTKYRLKEYDPINDIYILQKRYWWIFWQNISVGSKKKLEDFINESELIDWYLKNEN